MKKLFLAVLTVALIAIGCASLQTLSDKVIEDKKSGNGAVTKIYPVSADQAWEISEAVFRWEKTDEVIENRTENYMIASSGMKMAAFGSVLGVWIEPVDQKSTKITIITAKRGDCCELTNLTKKDFFQNFEKGVAIVNSGRKLPAISP